jgi:hypothetical protein
VSDIILEHMLQPEMLQPGKRKDAITIRTHWINRIIARDNTSTTATASTRPLESTAAPSPQPTPAAPLHSQASANPPRAGPPPPPPDFAPRRPTTMEPELVPRPPTLGSLRSVRTQEVPITIRQIAQHLRRPKPLRPQTLRLWLSRSGTNPETEFPGLSSTLGLLGSRNHVRCLPLKPRLRWTGTG